MLSLQDGLAVAFNCKLLLDLDMSDADQMVLAGSRPSHSSPIDGLHSRCSMVMLVDIFVIGMVLYPYSLIPAGVGLVLWLAYKKKVSWAYWFAPILMGLASLLFLFLLAGQMYSLFSGSGGSILLALLMAWAAFSSIRFIRIHFHPVYRMGYSGVGVNESGLEIHEGEMLASCPTCLAVLAINPQLLSPEDKCPHCEGRLVRSEEE